MKTVKKCAVCGFAVCVDENDKEPLCADCFIWSDNIRQHYELDGDIEIAVDYLRKNLNNIEDSLSIVDNLHTYRELFTNNRDPAIDSLLRLIPMVQEAQKHLHFVNVYEYNK